MLGRQELDVDIVVGGTGAGGLTAAIVAHDLGLKVIVLEKASVVGGGAAVSDGQVWVPGNHLERKEGIPDSDETIDEYLDHLSGGLPVNKQVRRAWIRASRAAVEYLEEKAEVRWRVIRKLADVFYGFLPSASSVGRYLEVEPIPAAELGDWKNKVLRSPFVPYFVTNDEMIELGGGSTLKDWPLDLVNGRIEGEVLCQGPGLIAYLTKAAVIDRRIPLHLGVGVKKLIVEGGRVMGVVVESEGKERRIMASKGVVLNTGGYDWDPTFPYFYEQLPEWHSVMPPTIDGDSIRLAADAGACFVPFKVYSANLGYHIPGEQWFGKDLYRQVLFEASLPHSIIVNKKGERFADESWFQDLSAKACINDKNDGFLNHPCFIIFDESYREKYPFGTIEPGRPFPEGFAAKAQTLQDLAKALRINEKGLIDTVEKFNKFASTGEDKDFARGSKAWSNAMHGDMRQKPNPNLGRIEKPPFYGIRLTFVGIGRNGGFLVDVTARVLNYNLESVPRLYACGNCVAGTEMGPTYQDGASLSRSIAFGYLAARDCGSSQVLSPVNQL